MGGVRFVQLFDWGWDFHGTSPTRADRRPDEEEAPTMDKARGGLDPGT